MCYDNGRVYEGSWIQDHREGKGYEKYDNSNVYIGDFSKGKCKYLHKPLRAKL